VSRKWKEVGLAAPRGPAAPTFSTQMRNNDGNWGAPETAHVARHKIWVGRPHHLGLAAPTNSSQTEHCDAKSRWFESLTQLVMLSYGYPIFLLSIKNFISCFWKCFLPILTSEMRINCHVKPLQGPSKQFYTLYAWQICWLSLKHEPELKLCGMQMLMTNPKLLTSMIWLDNVGLALSHSMVKISDEFLFENKTRQAPWWSYHLPKPYVDIKG
jgi:hypothetical protein